MQHIGMRHNDKDYKFRDYFYSDAQYLEEISKGDGERTVDYRYPNEASSEIRYFYDRSSGYNSLPYIPMVLSANYPHSKVSDFFESLVPF